MTSAPPVNESFSTIDYMLNFLKKYESGLLKNKPALWLGKIHLLIPICVLLILVNVVLALFLPVYFNTAFLFFANLLIIATIVYKWMKFQISFYSKDFNLNQHKTLYFLNTAGILFLSLVLVTANVVLKQRIDRIDNKYENANSEAKLRESGMYEVVVSYMNEKHYRNIIDSLHFTNDEKLIFCDDENIDAYYEAISLLNDTDSSRSLTLNPQYKREYVLELFQKIQNNSDTSYKEIKNRGIIIRNAYNLPAPKRHWFTYRCTTYLNEMNAYNSNIAMSQYFSGTIYIFCLIFIFLSFAQFLIFLIHTIRIKRLQCISITHATAYSIIIFCIFYFCYENLAYYSNPEYLQGNVTEFYIRDVLIKLKLYNDGNPNIMSICIPYSLLLLFPVLIFALNTYFIKLYYIKGKHPEK